MTRAEQPKVGDVVKSTYRSIPVRTVISLHAYDLIYETTTSKGYPLRRRPLYSTWRSWCRSHRATVINDQR